MFISFRYTFQYTLCIVYAHFIKADYRNHNALLEMKRIKGVYKGENITEIVIFILNIKIHL
jgi:hypothetical protein